jgi:hypothetical protein
VLVNTAESVLRPSLLQSTGWPAIDIKTNVTAGEEAAVEVASPIIKLRGVDGVDGKALTGAGMFIHVRVRSCLAALVVSQHQADISSPCCHSPHPFILT